MWQCQKVEQWRIPEPSHIRRDGFWRFLGLIGSLRGKKRVKGYLELPALYPINTPLREPWFRTLLIPHKIWFFELLSSIIKELHVEGGSLPKVPHGTGDRPCTCPTEPSQGITPFHYLRIQTRNELATPFVFLKKSKGGEDKSTYHPCPRKTGSSSPGPTKWHSFLLMWICNPTNPHRWCRYPSTHMPW